MKKILVVFCVLTTMGLIAQPTDKKNVGSVEINVIDHYKASVKQAVKISEQPNFKDTVTKKLPVNYRIDSRSLNFKYNPKAIAPAKIKKTRLAKLPRNLVTVGFGTSVTPLFEIYTGSSRNKNSSWGAHARYFYTQGGVRDIVFDKTPYRETEVDLYYQKLFRKYRLHTDLDANLDRASYYGITDDVFSTGFNEDLTWRNYNRFGGKVSIEGINSKSRAFFRKAAVGYHFLSDNYGTTEQTFSLPTQWLIPLQNEDFYTDFNFYYQNTTYGIDSLTTALGDTGSSPAFFTAQFLPKIKSNFGMLYFTVGLNIYTNSESRTGENPENKTRVYFFPELTFDLDLVPNILAAYAGWTGTLENNNIWSLKEQNPYINPFVQLQATATNNMFIGVKGKITNNLVYNLQAKYNLVDNMAIFYRDPRTFLSSKGFDVIYDKAQVVGLFGEVKLETKIGLDIAAFAEYRSYKLKNLAFAYNVPNIKSGVVIDYNWKEKITLTTNITYVGERTAFDHSLFTEGTTPRNPILGAYVDVRLGAEYKYNQNLSAFFNVTNLLSQRYQTWYGYPTQQIRFLIGLSYRF